MPTRYLMLKGNLLLMVFQKYLKYKNISSSEFINKVLDEIITENAEEFIDKVENEENRINKFPKLREGYKRLKELFLEAKVRGEKLEIPKDF
jgi:hypothetical protein